MSPMRRPSKVAANVCFEASGTHRGPGGFIGTNLCSRAPDAPVRRRRLLQRRDSVARVTRNGFGRGRYPAAAVPLGDRAAAVPDDEVRYLGMHGDVAGDRFEPVPPAMNGLRTVNAQTVDPLGQPFRYLLVVRVSGLAAARPGRLVKQRFSDFSPLLDIVEKSLLDDVQMDRNAPLGIHLGQVPAQHQAPKTLDLLDVAGHQRGDCRCLT
jgi:hypothetical protein